MKSLDSNCSSGVEVVQSTSIKRSAYCGVGGITKFSLSYKKLVKLIP